MSSLGRILALARVRLLEAARGPLATFLVLFLIVAAAGTLLLPGEPGPDRQRAVDAFVLNALLLVTALGAAAIGAASLPGDRETGRESLVAASPVRPPELLAGGLLGHLAALSLLAAGGFAGFLAITGLLGEGSAARTPTRVPIRGERLLDFRGRAAEGPVVLTSEAPAATYVLPAGRERVREAAEGGGGIRAWIDLIELPDPDRGIPDVYDVAVEIEGGVVRRFPVRRGLPLEFSLAPSDVPAGDETRVTIRRVDPAMAIAVAPGGLLAEGAVRSLTGNTARAALAWFFGLVVVAAAAGALSTLVGAPVAIAGTLLFTLVGRSLETLAEAAGHLERLGPASARVADGLFAVVGIWPDFDAYDRTRLISARWAIPAGDVMDRFPAALGAAAVLLLLGWLALAARRRM